MMDKVIDLLKNDKMIIPRTLLYHYKDLKITEEEFIILCYLLNEDKLLNPKKAATELKINVMHVLEVIESLSSKDILKIEVIKTGNIREDIINMDSLYHKLAFLIVNDKVEVTEKTNLFDIFEKEFGRTLSPIEFEIIKGWQENHFSEELIICALKEAVYNGVFRLNYIDKILFEWKKKGIQTKEDVEKNNHDFNAKKKEVKEEVFDYDWLNENG